MPEGKSIKVFHKSARYILHVNSHTEATRSQLCSGCMPGIKKISVGGQWKNTTSAVELNLPLDSSPSLLICKAGTSARVMLNWPQALGRITSFHSLKRRCLGEEGLFGSVESPGRFCGGSRAQDGIKKGGGDDLLLGGSEASLKASVSQ